MSAVSINIDVGSIIKEFVDGIIKFSPYNGLKRRWIGELKRELRRINGINYKEENTLYENYHCHCRALLHICKY